MSWVSEYTYALGSGLAGREDVILDEHQDLIIKAQITEFDTRLNDDKFMLNS